ncbi:MAG: hypothetical protein QE487_06805 [Fluviicola sp.]|nr:hypothetical protein [Fluviicola sp.]
MPNKTELLDDILDNNQLKNYPRNSKSWLLLLLIHFTLFGAGLVYVDKNLKRSWFYVICALYAWVSFANIFVEFSTEIREFHNHTFAGAISIFMGWGIAYLIGGIDALITFGMRKQGR